MTTQTQRPTTSSYAGGEYRVEGRDKVSGRMQYTADVHRPGMLWAAYATSPHAYAKIHRIDTTEAKKVPGVRAVLTAKDVGERYWGRNLYDWPVLCWDVVRMIGDRVAAIAADTREAAEEAARRVEVEYEELEPVLDPEAAQAAGAPIIHSDRPKYYHSAWEGKTPPTLTHPNQQGRYLYTRGESEPVFKNAHKVFEHRFQTSRVHAGYIEPHATLVWIDDDGTVHVQSPNKSPFALRGALARTVDVPANKIVIEPSAIGGDFGGKGMTVDEPPCYFLAKATGRPVRYVTSYTEELNSACQRHPATITLRTAVDKDGKFLAHHSTVVYDGGAYGGGKPVLYVLPGLMGYSSVPYHIPDATVDVTCYYTNTVPGAHVRTPADMQVFFAWEQHVDMMAQALGIDAIELRLRNVIREGQPTLVNELVQQPMGVEVLETLRRERDKGNVPAGRGRGVAITLRHTGGGKMGLTLRLERDGKIHTTVAAPDQGGGQFTVVQRVAAKTLGIPDALVDVHRGNTAVTQPDPGTGGARVTNSLSGAAHLVAGLLREELEKRTGLKLENGRFGKETWEQVAARVCKDGPVEVTGMHDASHSDPHHEGIFSFNGFCVEVDVDRDTGTVKVTDVVSVSEVGEIINPVAHQGQLDGGFIYGLGSTLMEELVTDESGKVTTLSLGEYKLPTIMDIPPFRTVLVEGPGDGPIHVKMAGELTNTGIAPAIANALHNAVGIRMTALPITSERVYDALNAG
jgi:carbon-monoxide dehydrogenase large subunit